MKVNKSKLALVKKTSTAPKHEMVVTNIPNNNSDLGELKTELSLINPNTGTVFELTHKAFETDAFYEIGYGSGQEWFSRELGNANGNQTFFRACLKASDVSSLLDIQPKLEYLNSLLVLSKVATKNLPDFFKLAQKTSNMDMSDPDSIQHLLDENPHSKRRKANEEVEDILSNLMQVFDKKYIKRNILKELKEEIQYVSEDSNGIRSLSLRQKQSLLLRIENM